GGGGAGGSLRAKLQGVFRSGGGGSSGAGPALAAALEPGAPCPGCQQTATVEGQTVLSCAAALADPAFFAAYAGHPLGLCLPHLRGTLRVIGDAALVQRVAGAQAARLATTAAELAEVIRKYDYRFQDEPHGAEFAAPARSVEQVGGRLPTQLNPPRA
ncbi:MAG TPA: hypothetical protein VKY74_01710, partial [Chloroflexia bacterium]|nr:hypothetical protein [Chloroflexia bacterium]